MDRAEDDAVLESLDEQLRPLLVAQLAVGPGFVRDLPLGHTEIVETAGVALGIAEELRQLRAGHESKANSLAGRGFARRFGHRRSLQSRPCPTGRSRS